VCVRATASLSDLDNPLGFGQWSLVANGTEPSIHFVLQRCIRMGKSSLNECAVNYSIAMTLEVRIA